MSRKALIAEFGGLPRRSLPNHIAVHVEQNHGSIGGSGEGGQLPKDGRFLVSWAGIGKYYAVTQG